MDTRAFFESARAAAVDAQRAGRELAEMEEADASLGGSGFEPRVRSTPDPDAIGRRVVSAFDRRAMLEARQEADYRLIDRACELLYGADNRSGLYALVGWPADAIYHHYLGLRTWEDAAALMGYSVRHVQTCVAAAFDLADANGRMWTELGIGMAE